MDDVVICEADLTNPDHQQAILTVLDSYASDIMGGGKSLSPEVQGNLIPALQKHPTTYILLAFADSQAVGLAICFLGFSTFAAKPLLNIHDLVVTPPARGRGVGSRLLHAVENVARKLGCCKITLEVLEHNVGAQRLYQRFGYLGGGSTPNLDSMWFLQKKLT